jgi:DNA-binding LacI/PurR family transcriptional regulator
MSSVREIAKSLGISRTTVSRAINNDPSVHPETRRRTLDMVNQLGYSPQIGRRITTYIGIMAAFGSMDARSSYISHLLTGANVAAREHGYNIVLLNIVEKRASETFTQYFMRKGIRGLVLAGGPHDTADMVSEIAAEGFPLVVLSDHPDDENVNFVTYDSLTGMCQAVHHLLDTGHRRIAFLRSPDQGATDRCERELGYRMAFDKAGIPVDESLVLHVSRLSDDGAKVVMNGLLAMSNPPTAVVVAENNGSVGVLNRALELGARVPEELSIIGFDDGDSRLHTYPMMSAVCQDSYRLGTEGVGVLLDLLDDNTKEPVRRVIPTIFEVRGTSASAPTGNPIGG